MNYNDAECQKHNIQWQTSEIGDECPACKAETELEALRKVVDRIDRAKLYRLIGYLINSVDYGDYTEEYHMLFDVFNALEKVK